MKALQVMAVVAFVSTLSVGRRLAYGQAAVRVDGIAAVVGAGQPGARVDVILRSDIELLARIVWIGRTSGPPSLEPLPSTLLQATLDRVVGELLISREAERVGAATPGAGDIVRERERLEASAGGPLRLAALLRLLLVPPSEIDRIALRRWRVREFLTASREGRGEAAGRQPETGKAAVEPIARRAEGAPDDATLSRARAHWIKLLRARTRVRMLASYVSRPAPQ